MTQVRGTRVIEEFQVQTAVVVGIILIAAVFVARSIYRKARGREGCGCSCCEMHAQCETGSGKPDSCEDR